MDIERRDLGNTRKPESMEAQETGDPEIKFRYRMKQSLKGMELNVDLLKCVHFSSRSFRQREGSHRARSVIAAITEVCLEGTGIPA